MTGDWKRPFIKQSMVIPEQARKEMEKFCKTYFTRFPRIANLIEQADKDACLEINVETNKDVPKYEDLEREKILEFNREEFEGLLDIQEKFKAEIKPIDLGIEDLQKKKRAINDNWKSEIDAFKKRHKEHRSNVLLELMEKNFAEKEAYLKANYERHLEYRKTAVQRVIDHYNWRKPKSRSALKKEEEACLQ